MSEFSITYDIARDICIEYLKKERGWLQEDTITSSLDPKDFEIYKKTLESVEYILENWFGEKLDK